MSASLHRAPRLDTMNVSLEGNRSLMRKSSFVVALTLAVVLSSLCAAAATDKAEQFELKIRPILANRCYGCHSSAPLGGLAVNTRNGLLKGGKSGPAVVPGNPEESLLIQSVNHTAEKLKMPMGQGKMPDSEIALLTAWVKDGAFWPESAVALNTPKSTYVITPEQRKFWAFQPITKPAPPAVISR